MEKNDGFKTRPRAVRMFFVLLVLFFICGIFVFASEEPVVWWTFDEKTAQSVTDRISGIQDSLGGNFRYVQGVRGNALKFDGYTTMIRREVKQAPSFPGAFTIESWVAVAAYPWNWCPVVSKQRDRKQGYALEIGPEGRLRMGVYIGDLWREVVSEARISLKQWTHLAGVFDPDVGLTIHIDGKEAARLGLNGNIRPARNTPLVVGMIHAPDIPAFIHREHGTLPDWFALDAILDEVKLHARALNPDEISEVFSSNKTSAPPDIPPRVLPSGSPGKGRFGAYYTRLNYYWEWDDLWRVDDHPDVVVQFDDSPVRVVFWRGTRFSPAWVSENNLWMADQSVEGWNNEEGCFEHMQDSHCRYSHVRILESSAARVLVHWRYALLSSRDNLWKVDEKTGWGCWIDEYYYIYPDQTGIRKVQWQTGSLGRPRQFQETIPLTGPGQVQGDIINEDYVTVANLKGETQVFEYVENPERETSKTIPEDPLIQRHNFKSKNKPFIIFELGGRMRYLKDMNIGSLARSGSCTHWPVGQLPCDGRTSRIPDRAASFLGFPITNPIVHEGEDSRNWVNSLYGMGEVAMDELVHMARSWNRAPRLEIRSSGFDNEGYDQSQRAYVIHRSDSAVATEIKGRFTATADSPLHNLCLILKNWGKGRAELRLDGLRIKPGKTFKQGFVRHLDGTNLILWIEKISEKPVDIHISPAR